jgi:hypothetical protein
VQSSPVWTAGIGPVLLAVLQLPMHGEKLGPLRAALWEKRVQDGEVRAFYTHGNCGSMTFDLVRRSIIRRVGSRREYVGAVFLAP